jgi:hypothetical protein
MPLRSGGVEDGGGRDDRWAALAGAFDPVENLRVIGEIQRMGLDAATRLLDRFADADQEAPSGRDERESPLFGVERDVDGDVVTELRNVRAGAERFVDLMAEAAKRVIEAGVGVAAAPSRDASARVVIATLGGVGTGEVAIPSGAAGLLVGELRSHDGRTLADASVRSQVIGVTAEATRVVLRVDVPPGAEPGVYHGVAVAEGLVEFSIPVTVHVAAQ